MLTESIPYLAYESYISSARWRDRRQSFLSDREQVCDACGSDSEIQVHHRSYERFTREEDADLRCLCSTCHKWVHVLHRTSRLDLEAATDQVIHAQRSRPLVSRKPDFVRTRGFSNTDLVFARVRGREDMLPGQYNPASA